VEIDSPVSVWELQIAASGSPRIKDLSDAVDEDASSVIPNTVQEALKQSSRITDSINQESTAVKRWRCSNRRRTAWATDHLQ
jgi:hypothetical protein